MSTHTSAPAPLDRIDDRARALPILDAWVRRGLVLQKAEGSSAHRFLDAFATHDVLDLFADRGAPATYPHLPFGLTSNIFVVQHDWAEAFKGAQDFDQGDFRLPYDISIFEFRISGRRVCALVVDLSDKPKTIMPFVEEGRQWFATTRAIELIDGHWVPKHLDPDNPFNAIPRLIAAQVKAICVSLEAEVAVGDTIKIPEKLNAARVRRGKTPLPEYNIVRLNRGIRQNRIEGDASHAKRRLHFRRGHWRHLSEDRKTWVRWCLVGDPDLGFIDKEYRL